MPYVWLEKEREREREKEAIKKVSPSPPGKA
jgi:hypothetical protein